MPFADTQAMQAHIDEIGQTVAKGAHAVLLLDLSDNVRVVATRLAHH